MKKILSLLLTAALLIALPLYALADQKTVRAELTYRGITVSLNGKTLAPADANGNAVEPFLYQNTTWLPVRAVAGALGLSADWNGGLNTVVLRNGGTVNAGSGQPLKSNRTRTAELTFRDIRITVDGKVLTPKDANGNTVEPFLLDNSTYLPLRAVAGAFGLSVDWNAEQNLITLGSGGESGAVRLAQTADAGQSYLDKMVFLGDSTTYGMGYYHNHGYPDLCSPAQIWTPASGTLTLSYQSTATIVYPDTGEELSIRECARRKQPEYLVITLGVNGVSFMDQDWFIREYTDLVRGVQEVSPNTKIICNSIFPVAASYKYVGDINNRKIGAANGWIESVAEATGTRFLNTYEALVGADGFLPESAHNGDGLHLTGDTFRTVLSYIRTHAYP